MLAASKSGAWLSTVSSTAWAKPSCRCPMTLMGKSQGNFRRDSSLTRAHHRLLEILVPNVHLFEDGPRPSRADRPAIQRCDRQHLLGRGGHPQFVGGARLVLEHVAH